MIGGTQNPLMRTELKTLNLLKEQKRLKDGWAVNNKEPIYTAIALDLASAAKAFENVKTILTPIRGVLGVPLIYVIRHLLIPKDEDNDPTFGDPSTPLTTMRQSLAALSYLMTVTGISGGMNSKLKDPLSQPSSLTRKRFGLFSACYSRPPACGSM